MRSALQSDTRMSVRGVAQPIARVLLPAAVAAATLLLVTFADLPGNAMYSRVMQDFAHVPAFALITWALMQMLGASSAPRYLAAAGVSVLLGTLVEVVQRFTGGDSSLMDIWRDVLGISTAVALKAMITRSDAPVTWRNTAVPALIGALALVCALVPLAECSRAYRHRTALFPVLADFSSRFDTYLLRATDPPFHRIPLPPDAEGSPQGALVVPYSTATWPGVVFEEPVPNWSVFKDLAIDIENSSLDPQAVLVGIHDATYDGSAADRFTARYQIPARTRVTLRIPLADVRNAPRGRKLDLRHIGRLAIAHVPRQPAEPFTLYKVWLE